MLIEKLAIYPIAVPTKSGRISTSSGTTAANSSAPDIPPHLATSPRKTRIPARVIVRKPSIPLMFSSPASGIVVDLANAAQFPMGASARSGSSTKHGTNCSISRGADFATGSNQTLIVVHHDPRAFGAQGCGAFHDLRVAVFGKINP